MRLTFSKSINHSLLVDEEGLRSLCRFIKEKYNDLRLSARCNDGTRLDEVQVDDLISYDNASNRKITSISLDARSSISDKTTLEIHTDFYMRSAQLEIACDDNDRLVLVSQKILNALNDMKPWYDWVARVPWTWVLTALSILFALWSSIDALFSMPRATTSQTPFTTQLLVLLIALTTLLGVFTVMLFIIVEKLQRFLFPRVFFLLGKQKATMENIKFWRVISLTVVIIPFIVGIAVSMVFDASKAH